MQLEQPMCMARARLVGTYTWGSDSTNTTQTAIAPVWQEEQLETAIAGMLGATVSCIKRSILNAMRIMSEPFLVLTAIATLSASAALGASATATAMAPARFFRVAIRRSSLRTI